MQFVATCLFGLEKLLGEEIDALGCRRIDTIDGRVTFEGAPEDAAKANINFRCAEHVFIKIGDFRAESFTELFDGTYALPWEDYIGENDAFPVKGHSIRSTLYSIPDCQSIIKKACVERLKSKYGISYFEETGVKYQIEFFILKDNVHIMIDTSGTPLHKRGYRPTSNEAPIRETLAAALVKLAHTRDDVLFWDPFCGSGTIPIEAAMLMTNTAPGLNREFISENFPQIPKKCWYDAVTEANDKIIRDCSFEAFASDISPECVEITNANVKRAGMEKYIKVFCRDALTIEPYDRRGTVVCNPPYGERLMSADEVEALYRNMGKAWQKLGSWQIYVISSCEDFQRLYGRRADSVRRLYNGMIRCNYYQYFRNKKKT